MKKGYIILMLLHLSFLDVLSITTEKVSEEMIKCYSSFIPEINKFQEERYNKLRQELDFIKILDVKLQDDTIFVLQSYNRSNSNLYMCIAFWNSRKQFFCEKKYFTLYTVKEGCYPFFTKYMVQLVNEWNIEELKREAEINGVISDVFYIASRIIFKNKKYTVECMSFKGFYNLKRDSDPCEFLEEDELLIPYPSSE